MRRFAAASILAVGCRAAAPSGAGPTVEPADTLSQTAEASPKLDISPKYRTMLSLPCAIVDARTIACMARHSVKVERYALDDTFDPEDHLVHLDRVRNRVCALVRPSGRIFCWTEEQGPSRSDDAPTGVDFATVAGAVDFGLLEDGLCVLSDGGQVRCAGKNDAAQLGDGTRDDHDALEPVELPGKAVDIETGWKSACAQLSSGDVYCWGDNATADDPRRIRPTKIRGLPTNAMLVSTGELATPAGERWRWTTLDHVPDRGYTTPERLEDSYRSSLTCWRVQAELWCETGPDDAPEKLLDGVVEVDLQHAAYCARLEDRSVWCVGHSSRLASPAPEVDPLEPTRVPGLVAVSAVAMSSQGACAIHDGGKVSCWGDAPTAHAPNQNPRFVGTPRVVSLGGSARDLVVAKDGACALVDGRAHCWGRNGKILDLGPADDLMVHGDQPCAVAASTATCMQEGPAWYRDPDLIEITTKRPSVQTDNVDLQAFDPPLKVRRGKDRLLVGGRVACVLGDDGRLRCRGDSYGQPIEVTRDDIVQASAGLETVCAIDRSSQIACWGSLGFQTRESAFILADIGDARSIHVGGSIACAIRADGSLWCWGGSSSGERGLGGEAWSESWTPIRLEALQGQ